MSEASMRSPVEEGLLLEIRENLADDIPRSIYADWLEDQGDEVSLMRSELIRVQCRLARLTADDPGYDELEVRSGQLLEPFQEWLKPLRHIINYHQIRRGMVEGVTLSTELLATHGRHLPQLAPVALVTLDADEADWERMVECPHLRHVHRIDARGDMDGDAAVEALADSPHVDRLRGLVMHSCRLTTACVPDLLRLDLSRLELLNVGANNFGDAGMAELCAHPALGNLRDLGVGGNDLHAGSAQALATSPVLRRLRRINIGANYLDDDDIELLAAAPHLASLRDLDVRANEFHQRGAMALAGSPHLGDLEFLDVCGNALRGRARRALTERFGDRVKF